MNSDLIKQVKKLFPSLAGYEWDSLPEDFVHSLVRDNSLSLSEKDIELNNKYDAAITKAFKHGEEVGVNNGYMTGYDEGSKKGREIGYDEGYHEGYDDGYADNKDKELNEYDKGYNAGCKDTENDMRR